MTASTTHHFGSEYREVTIENVAVIADDAPLRLDCGLEVRDIPIAYEAYGTLNDDASNAILLCHALTGDQFVASEHPVTGKVGWWENMVGPDKPIDTDKYFVICSNVIGSCVGSWGPKSINPDTGKAYGLDFPVITLFDMVRAQERLISKLGISKLFAVIGGSMGGMQVLGWTALFAEKVHAAMPIATAPKHSAQNIAFHEIGRQAIMADPQWCGGRYMDEKRYPAKGLSVARMTAHVTYLSESALHQKFGRELQNKERVSYGFEADFQIESYLRYQGANFVERFDANAYLYITRAMDYYDLASLSSGSLADVFRDIETRFCVVSFSSDWLYPTVESRAIVRALNGVAADVRFAEITTDKGHDAFLLDIPEFAAMIEGFLKDVSISDE